jgi:hypothetical protein
MYSLYRFFSCQGVMVATTASSSVLWMQVSISVNKRIKRMETCYVPPYVFVVAKTVVTLGRMQLYSLIKMSFAISPQAIDTIL